MGRRAKKAPVRISSLILLPENHLDHRIIERYVFAFIPKPKQMKKDFAISLCFPLPVFLDFIRSFVLRMDCRHLLQLCLRFQHAKRTGTIPILVLQNATNCSTHPNPNVIQPIPFHTQPQPGPNQETPDPRQALQVPLLRQRKRRRVQDGL